MFRAHRATSRVDLAWRLLTPLLAVALVLSVGLVAPAPAEAGGSSAVITLRQRQLAAEEAMRRADKQIDRLQKQRGNHAKLLRAAKQKLRKAIKRRRTVERTADKARAQFRELELALARETRVRPNPKGTQKVDKPKLRKRVRTQAKQVRQLDKRVRQAKQKESKVRALKRSRANKPTKARIEARRGERERSEAKLSAAINAMISLSKDRAGRVTTASTKAFVRPARGNITQSFGCTGYRANPRLGSCRHFHDGVDIAAPKGTKVRASADGYVAYAGFSPWDNGRRAYIVIIGHANGYESVYAHLQPTRKVRAGQKVKRGAPIATIGMTGLTSGPHVHWEVKKGGTNLNPLGAGR
jgi:murein DD-endopeptidase MepM/ murein hydrolase activator NlpD